MTYDPRDDYEECCRLATASNRLPILAAAINAEYLAALQAAYKATEHAVTCGQHLLEAKSLLPHGEWLPWLEANTRVVPRQSQKYMRLAENWDQIKAQANFSSHLSINETLELIADQRVGRVPITLSTGNPHWFTPDEVLAAVRATFGGEISLDPASCAEAQERVKAKAFFDEAANGLEREWGGNVFLNPPYSAPLIRAFVDKLVFEFESGRVGQAILLANDQTDASWFQRAASSANLFCFPYKRLNFYSPDRDNSSSNVCNSALFYFGDAPARFQAAFSEMAYFCRLVNGGAA